MLSNGRMKVNNDVIESGRKRSCPNLRYHSSTKENHTVYQDSCTGKDLAQAPPRYKSEVSTVSASLFSEHHSRCQDYTALMIQWLMNVGQLVEWELAAVPLCPQQIPGCCGRKPPVLQHGQSSVSQHNLSDISLHASCNLFHLLRWVVASVNFRRKMICEPHKMTCMGITLINWVYQKCRRHFFWNIL